MSAYELMSKINRNDFLTEEIAGDQTAVRSGGKQNALILGKIGNLITNLPRLLGVALFLVLWECAPRFELIDPTFIPSFSTVAKAWINLLVSRRAHPAYCCQPETILAGIRTGAAAGAPSGTDVGVVQKV